MISKKLFSRRTSFLPVKHATSRTMWAGCWERSKAWALPPDNKKSYDVPMKWYFDVSMHNQLPIHQKGIEMKCLTSIWSYRFWSYRLIFLRQNSLWTWRRTMQQKNLSQKSAETWLSAKAVPAAAEIAVWTALASTPVRRRKQAMVSKSRTTSVARMNAHDGNH